MLRSVLLRSFAIALLAGVAGVPAPGPRVTTAADAQPPGYPVIELEPSADTTLREADPSFNDGTHRVLQVGTELQGFRQRALLAVDPGEAIPPGSRILSARLVFFVDDVASNDSSLVTLHRIRTPWREGVSGEPTGGATWSHAVYPELAWDAPGGDAYPYPSGGTWVEGVGRYEITGGNLVGDLQAMLDDPESNHGWALAGSEDRPETWKQFGSRDFSSPASRPRWIVEYSPRVDIESSSVGRWKTRFRPRSER